MSEAISSLIDEREAAKLLSVAPRTLQYWRWAGRGPAFVKIGGAVRYHRRDLDDFVSRGRREPSAASEAEAVQAEPRA